MRLRRSLYGVLIPADSAASTPSLYWSPTDNASNSDFAYTNPDIVTPKTMERISGGSANMIGRAVIPGASIVLGERKKLKITCNTRTGFMTFGACLGSTTLSQYLGNSTDSVGYQGNSGEVGNAGVTIGAVEATWTTGDSVWMIFDRRSDGGSGNFRNVYVSKDDITYSSAKSVHSAMATADWVVAWHSQVPGCKITLDSLGSF